MCHSSSARTWCGTRICPTRGRDNSTAIACTARGIPRAVTASIPRTKCCSIRTRATSGGPLNASIASLFAYAAGSEGDGGPDDTDSAPYAPLGRVIDPSFDWGDDRHPGTPWHDTVIYEMHVKGFSATNPHVPAALRGMYGGVAADASLHYLRDLGVTSVELMPVHAHVDDQRASRSNTG